MRRRECYEADLTRIICDFLFVADFILEDNLSYLGRLVICFIQVVIYGWGRLCSSRGATSHSIVYIEDQFTPLDDHLVRSIIKFIPCKCEFLNSRLWTIKEQRLRILPSANFVSPYSAKCEYCQLRTLSSANSIKYFKIRLRINLRAGCELF